MTWVKLDDGFADHPKVVGLSDRAFRVHVRAMCYAGRYSPGVGLIPAAYLRQIGVTAATLKELIGSGLWEKAEDGAAIIHDFGVYNPPPNTEARAAAGRLGGIRSGESRRQNSGKDGPARSAANQHFASSQIEANASANAKQAEASALSITRVAARARPDPSPSRPDPDPTPPLRLLPLEAGAESAPEDFRRVVEAVEATKHGRPNPVELEKLADWTDEFGADTVIAAIKLHGEWATSLQPAKNSLDGWGPGGEPKSERWGDGEYNGGPGGDLEDRKRRYLGGPLGHIVNANPQPYGAKRDLEFLGEQAEG